MLVYLLFIVGFFLLIKGADLLVDGASASARRFGMSPLVIGLTIVALGTSMPELVVNVLATIQGNGDIAIGNVIGSNIANILLILGASAFVFPLSISKGTTWKEIPFSLLATVVLFFLVGDRLIDGASASVLTRVDGLILLSYLAIFMYYVFGISKAPSKDELDIHTHSGLVSFGMIAIGIIGLSIGGKWVVDGAVAFARLFGVSEALVGLTIVAIGTSLPELATSLVAALKKKSDIAVGNVVGSNILNIFLVLGVSAVIRPLQFTAALMQDLFVAAGTTVLLFLLLFVGKKHTLERWQGGMFVGLYIAYLIVLVLRG